MKVDDLNGLLEPDLSSAILVRLRRSYEIDRLLNPDFDRILLLERPCSNKTSQRNHRRKIYTQKVIKN